MRRREGGSLTGGPEQYPEGQRPRITIDGDAVRLTRPVFTERPELRVSLDDTRDARSIGEDIARVFCVRPPHLARLAAEVVRVRDEARAKRDRGGG